MSGLFKTAKAEALAQKHVDRIFKWFVVDNHLRAWDAGTHSCVYAVNGDLNRRCAVGCLIPDDYWLAHPEAAEAAISVDDDNVGGTSGNGDGVADAGEIVDVRFRVIGELAAWGDKLYSFLGAQGLPPLAVEAIWVAIKVLLVPLNHHHGERG